METEFGSACPVRFILKNENPSTETVCIDCEAKSLVFALEEIDFENPDLDLIQSMKKMHEALLFILWNTNWPASD